jgi:hypothetical protein
MMSRIDALAAPKPFTVSTSHTKIRDTQNCKELNTGTIGMVEDCGFFFLSSVICQPHAVCSRPPGTGIWKIGIASQQVGTDEPRIASGLLPRSAGFGAGSSR